MHPSSHPIVRLAVACWLGAGLVLAPMQAQAQGWNWWPFGQPEKPPPPPVPREPVYRGPQQNQPYPGDYPGQQPPPGQQPAPGREAPRASNICLQLEQRLVAEGQFGQQGRDILPRLESDMRQVERTIQTASAQLDRFDCWDSFLFTKTLRRTQRCIQLNSDLESGRQRLADLEAQRRQILGRGDRSYQDDIIRELARNGCGPQYQTEARRRDAARNPFSSFEETDEPRQGGGNQFGQLPFATYRTLCVRLCDGYYFPVSFSTLPNHFQRDADVCQSQCAAPAELYYHQNPGGAVDQMVSITSQQPYTSLKTAWRYRKEFVSGCSCKQAEYKPAPGTEKKAEAPAAPAQSQPPALRPATTARVAPQPAQ